MVGGGDPFYLKFWFNRSRWSKIADFEPIFARIASVLTHSEKKFKQSARSLCDSWRATCFDISSR